MMGSLNDGYAALVIGASGGIGSAVLKSLEDDPRCGAVETLSRDDVFDLLDERSIERAALRAIERHAVFDLVFDATGALTLDGIRPEKSLRSIDAAAMAGQFAVNAIGPALLLKHFSPLLPKGRRCLFATLSARVGSIEDNRLGGWVSYRASKAALNQIVRTAAIEIGRTRPEAVVVSLHPGTVATRLSEPFAGTRERAAPATAARQLLSVLDALTPAASGGFFDYAGRAIAY